MNKDVLQKAVEAALRRAFDLGQLYWQQADSESYKQNAKADATQAKFDSLVAETVSSFQQQPEPVALKDGVPNTEAAIAYGLERWGYRQGTRECIAFYRGACWLQLATPPAQGETK